MAAIWLSGFDRVTSPFNGGGTMLDVSRKFVGHTTEGVSKDPHGSAAAHPHPPHCWVCLPSHPHKPRTRIQIVPLDRSAFALLHNDTDPATNKAGAVQVEIEGFSAGASAWSAEDLDWLADEVVGPMCRAVGVDPSQFVDTSKVTRMSWDGWRGFNGLCCHRNVPGNEHTDAPIDLAHVATRIGHDAGAGLVPPEHAEESMLIQHPDGHLEMFDVSDGALRQNWQAAAKATKWSGWKTLDANHSFVKMRGAVRGDDGNINVVANAADGDWALWFDQATHKWNGPVKV